LCGIYTDEIPLKLYTTKKTIAELRKAYLRQEEIICALKTHESDAVVENTRALIGSMTFSKEKLGRRSTTKDEKAEVKMTTVDVDGGWDVDAYKMTKEDDGTCVPKALPPASFYEAYGQKAPSEGDREAYEEKHEEEEVDDENFKDGDIYYIDLDDVSGDKAKTFDHIWAFAQENANGKWINRTDLTHHLAEKLGITNDQAFSKTRDCIKMVSKNKPKEGVVFKFTKKAGAKIGKWQVMMQV